MFGLWSQTHGECCEKGDDYCIEGDDCCPCDNGTCCTGTELAIEIILIVATAVPPPPLHYTFSALCVTVFPQVVIGATTTAAYYPNACCCSWAVNCHMEGTCGPRALFVIAWVFFGIMLVMGSLLEFKTAWVQHFVGLFLTIVVVMAILASRWLSHKRGLFKKQYVQPYYDDAAGCQQVVMGQPVQQPVPLWLNNPIIQTQAAGAEQAPPDVPDKHN